MRTRLEGRERLGERGTVRTHTLSVEPRGGRGEAGARSLERTLPSTPGVHDADVSFRIGTVSIDYDDATTSTEVLERVVRDYGVSIPGDSGAGRVGRSPSTSRSPLGRSRSWSGRFSCGGCHYHLQ